MTLATVLLLGTLAWPAGASEQLAYDWEVRGLARLILPSGGQGLLTTASEGESVRTELLITAPASDDFYRYGSRLDRASGELEAAWSSYRFGSKEKARDQEVETPGVVDIAAGILLLRRDPPTTRRNLIIWSDGRLYPVTVENLGLETVDLASGDRQAHHYTIRGRNLAGQRQWKGSLDLWLGVDAEATPVKIEVARSFSRVELKLRADAS